MRADPLRPEEILRRLPSRRRLARRIEILQAVDSTNDEARRRLTAGASTEEIDGWILAAEEQTGGRGRRERDWWSGPPTANLAVTLILSPPVDPPEALGVIGACAMVAAIRPFTRRSLSVKWPNDILLDGAKVAGFLAEAPSLPPDHPKALLLGFGVNVHAAPPAKTAAYPTACLAEGARRPPDRTALLAAWIAGCEARIARTEFDRGRALEREFLALLKRWAPYGVSEPGTERRGPLIEFGLSDGLTWGFRNDRHTRPAGLVSELEPLPAPS